MTKYSHRWLLSNSKATDNNMICPYCYRSEETLDHDHFLTCNESDERKEVRIHSFKQLLNQLKTPKALTSTLINGLKLAYQEHQHPTSQPSKTQHTIIGWTNFIRGRIPKDLTNIMSTFYRTLTQPSQRFSGIGWTKAVVTFMLETHVTK